MEITNYHLFDFMDFDSDLKKNESLWKSCSAQKIYEKNGDIYIDVPFQKQVLSNEMQADLGYKKEIYTIILRQYNDNILRIYADFADEEYEISDKSEMLKINKTLKKQSLSVIKLGSENSNKSDGWAIYSKDGKRRAIINTHEPKLDRWSDLLPDPQETFDLRLFPDGEKEIRLSSYDHFSPPRYDALPVAFCKTDNYNERITISFVLFAINLRCLICRGKCQEGRHRHPQAGQAQGQSLPLHRNKDQAHSHYQTFCNILSSYESFSVGLE